MQSQFHLALKWTCDVSPLLKQVVRWKAVVTSQGRDRWEMPEISESLRWVGWGRGRSAGALELERIEARLEGGGPMAEEQDLLLCGHDLGGLGVGLAPVAWSPWRRGDRAASPRERRGRSSPAGCRPGTPCPPRGEPSCGRLVHVPHASTTARGHRWGLLLLRDLRDHAHGRYHEPGDAGGVLQRDPRDLGGVDDPGGH